MAVRKQIADKELHRNNQYTQTMKKILLISLIISVFGVSCSGRNNITEKAKIQEVIENHDKTLIFVWAEYCEASKMMLEQNIQPYLERLEKNDVGIVVMYYGGEEVVASLSSSNRLILTSDIRIPLLVKRDANKTMKSLLKNFRKTQAMPIPLLVDKNGIVLNYDENGSSSYVEIFKAAE